MAENIIQFFGVIFLFLVVLEAFRVQIVRGWKRIVSATVCLVLILVGMLLIARPDIIINISNYLIAR
jgi:hypothetical protein